MLRYSPCEAENEELEIGGGGTGKTHPLFFHVTQPNVPSTEMFRLVFRLESQGIFKVSELGVDAMQVPGVKCWRGHSFKNRISRPSRKENLLYGKIGEAQEEDGRERASGNAGEGPKITKKTRRSTGRGDAGFE